MTPRATLYLKPGCHLCEATLAHLERLNARHPHTLELIDITASDDLMHRYGERIPVLRIGAREYDAPLAPAVLERALQQAAIEQPSPPPREAPRADPPVPSSPDGTPRGKRGLGFVDRALGHWLAILNVAIGLFVAGALAAPVFAAVGWSAAADGLYAAYHFTCHQWAFRSFFLFGQQAVYSEQQLAGLSFDPFRFVGGQGLGWKMAFCERDLAIYLGLLLVGILYARRRAMRASGFVVYGVLILPMAVDGFTQLFGWRESTWELRVATGLLFGLASAWLVLPRLDSAFGLQPASTRYAPDAACEQLSTAPRRV